MPLEQPSQPDPREKEPISYEGFRRLIGEFDIDVHDTEEWNETKMDQRRKERIASHQFGLLDVFDINADAFRKQALRLVNERRERKLSSEEEQELIASHQHVTKLEAMAKATDVYVDLLKLYDDWSQKGLVATSEFAEQIEIHKEKIAGVAERKVDLSIRVISGAEDIADTYKEQDQLSERLRSLLAVTDSDVPGANPEGVLPLYRGLLSMLEHEYRMTVDKQRIVLKSPEKTTDALKLLEELKLREAKNIERLTTLTLNMGRYQIYQAELTSIRHHFDQAYDDTDVPPRTGPQLDEAKKELPEFLQDQQNNALDSISLHLQKVEEGVTKVGLIEKTETLWNEHARVFLARIAERVVTLETAWIPGERGSFMERALRERLLAGLADTMGWPRDERGRLKSWAEMLPTEREALLKKQDSIEKTIDRFDETHSLDRLKTSVDAAKALISREDLAAENFIQAGEIEPNSLPRDTVTADTIDALVQQYGAPVVYRMTFLQLSENWEVYGKSYAVLLQDMNAAIGVHFDVAEFQKGFGDKQIQVMKLLTALAALAGAAGAAGGWLLWKTGKLAARQGARWAWRGAETGLSTGAKIVREAPRLVTNPNAALPISAILLEAYRLNIARGIKPLPEYQAVTDALEFWQKNIEPDAYTKSEIAHLEERQAVLAMIGNLTAPFEKPRELVDVPRSIKQALPVDFERSDRVLYDAGLRLRETAKRLQDRVQEIKLHAEQVNAEYKANFPIDAAFGSAKKLPGRTTVKIGDVLAVRKKGEEYRKLRTREFQMRDFFKTGKSIEIPPSFQSVQNEYKEFEQYQADVTAFNVKVDERERLIESLQGLKR